MKQMHVVSKKDTHVSAQAIVHQTWSLIISMYFNLIASWLNLCLSGQVFVERGIAIGIKLDGHFLQD